jgi:hypothetical protein
MPTLLELQHAVFRAVVAGESATAASHILEDALAPAERLDVYRNNFFASLTNALRLSFPAVHRLVGEEFFDALAQSFIAAEPPQSAYLNAYGAGFADYIAQFPAASSLPYLADVAGLEWAVNRALHAPDVQPLKAEEFAAIAGVAPEHLVLTPHPSIGLLHFDRPIEEIWRAVLAQDDEGLGSIDLNAGPQYLIVERSAAGVQVSRLDEAEWRFTADLCAGESFAAAADAASDLDISPILAGHLAAGRFTGFHQKASVP